MSKCYDNPEYDDLGNGLQNTWEHSPLKQEQKQHLIDMMNDDEDLGLYNETFDEYLIRLKDRRTEDDYKYTDEDFEKYDEYIMDSWRCGMSVYKCLEFMYFAEKEIQPEQVWNEEKKKGIKQLIQDHKKETLEEAKIKHTKFCIENNIENPSFSFDKGAKWQQERSYSDEEILPLLEMLQKCKEYFLLKTDKYSDERADAIIDVMEQFKKK
jgi:hypothetical protein